MYVMNRTPIEGARFPSCLNPLKGDVRCAQTAEPPMCLIWAYKTNYAIKTSTIMYIVDTVNELSQKLSPLPSFS